MKQKKPSYNEVVLRSAASSWWSFLPLALKEVGNTIGTLKKKLESDSKFNEIDLPELRKLYAQLRDLSSKNKDAQNFNGPNEEKELLKQMFAIINSYFDRTSITAGIQKRITRTMAGSPVGTVDNYYYKVGYDKEFASLPF